MDLIKQEILESKLIQYNGLLVLVDKNVAELYGIEIKDVNKAVKNNSEKFPLG